jgi:glycosyltransferase involved in cell wall biosynthesis
MGMAKGGKSPMSELFPRVGYVPYSNTLEHPGDRRRFVAYAREKNLPFELARPEERYDVVVLSELADISIWCRYPHGKIVYDFINSYLAIPRTNIRQWLRGPVWFAMGRHRRLRLDYWRALQDMCRRADAVVCTTKEQQLALQKYCTNVHRVLDVHSSVVQGSKENYSCSKPFNLVWEGLPSNIPQLMQIRNVLREISSRCPLILNIVTDPSQPRLLGGFGRMQSIDLARQVFDAVIVHLWHESTCSQIVQRCDLAVIPIDLDDPLVSGKPENKLLLLWRMGMPVVTSATPAYQRAMDGAGLGHLACRNEDDWSTCLEQLIGDETMRRDAGQRGQALAETEYGDKVLFNQWDKVFESLGFRFKEITSP